MGTSISRLNNRSRYERVDWLMDNPEGSRGGILYQGQGCGEVDGKGVPVRIRLWAYDKKGRMLKQLDFVSWNDATWEITTWGARLVELNYHSKEQVMKMMFGKDIPRNHYWTNDNEGYYNEMDRREEQRRREEEARRREEARQNAEATKREEAAMEASLENQVAERREKSERIKTEIQQKQQMAMVQTQRTIGWRAMDDVNPGANKNNFQDLAQLAIKVQEKIELMKSDENPLDILTSVMTFIKTRPSKAFDLFDNFNIFLEKTLSTRNISGTTSDSSTHQILPLIHCLSSKENLDHLPLSTLKTLLKITINFGNNWDLISNSETLTIAVYLFKRMGPKSYNNWDPENVPFNIKLKMVTSLHSLPRLAEFISNPKVEKNLEDSEKVEDEKLKTINKILEVLKLLSESADGDFPTNLASWYVEIFLGLYSMEDLTTEEEGNAEANILDSIFPTLLELIEKKRLQTISPQLIDFVLENIKIQGNSENKGRILQYALDSGLITPNLLKYLEDHLVSQSGTMFDRQTMIPWLAQHIQSGGSLTLSTFRCCFNFLKINQFYGEKLPHGMARLILDGGRPVSETLMANFRRDELPLINDIVDIFIYFMENYDTPAIDCALKDVASSQDLKSIIGVSTFSISAKAILLRFVLRYIQLQICLDDRFNSHTGYFPIDKDLAIQIHALLDNPISNSAAEGCLHLICQKDVNLMGFYNIPNNPIVPYTLCTLTSLNVLKCRLESGILFDKAAIENVAVFLTEVEKEGENKKPTRFYESWDVIEMALNVCNRAILSPQAMTRKTLIFHQMILDDAQIFVKESSLKLLATVDLGRWLGIYLDHAQVSVRVAALRLLLTLLLNEDVQTWTNVTSQVMLAFRGWDNEEEHELASKCLVKIIERVETPADRVKYLKDIMKFADPSAFSCYKNIAENSLSVLMAWIKGAENELSETDVKFLISLKSGKFGPSMLYRLFSLALSLNIQNKEPMVTCLLEIAKTCKEKLPFECIPNLQLFLNANDGEFSLKERIADVLAHQYEKHINNTAPIILSTIESTITYGNPHMVAIYAKAAYYHAKKSRIDVETQEKISKIALDKRFDPGTRKNAAKAVFWVEFRRKEEQPNIKRLLRNIIKLLEDERPDICIYGLFLLCLLGRMELPEEEVDDAISKLKELLTNSVTARDETSSEVGPKLSEFNICLAVISLIRHILPTLARYSENECGTVGDGNVDWISIWLDLHPEDHCELRRSDQSLANYYLSQEDGGSQNKGHLLKMDADISRAHRVFNTNTDMSTLSFAESILHKALNYYKANNLQSNETITKLCRLLANMYFLQGKSNAALKTLRIAYADQNSNGKVNLEAEDVELVRLVSYSLINLGRYDTAKEIFQKCSGFDEEIQLCEKLKELYRLILENTGSKTIAKSQIKCLITKMGRANKNRIFSSEDIKMVREMVEFLMQRGKYLDLSVIPTSAEWRVQLLLSEIFGKVAEAKCQDELYTEGDGQIEEIGQQLEEPEAAEEQLEAGEEQPDADEEQPGAAENKGPEAGEAVEQEAAEDQPEDARQQQDVSDNQELQEISNKNQERKPPIEIKISYKLQDDWIKFQKSANELLDYFRKGDESNSQSPKVIQLLETLSIFLEKWQPTFEELLHAFNFLKMPLKSSIKLIQKLSEEYKINNEVEAREEIPEGVEEDAMENLHSPLQKLQQIWLISKVPDVYEGIEADSQELLQSWHSLKQSSKLGFTFLEKFVETSLVINSVKDITFFFLFCEARAVPADHVATALFEGNEATKATLSQWMKLYMKHMLNEKLQKALVQNNDREELTEKTKDVIEGLIHQLQDLFENEIYEEVPICNLIKHLEGLDNEMRTQLCLNLFSIFGVCSNYQLETSEEWPDLQEIIHGNNSSNSSISQWLPNIRSTLRNKITGGVSDNVSDKSLEILFEEYQHLNKNNHQMLPAISNLRDFFESLKRAIDSPSNLGICGTNPIRNWDRGDVLEWSMKFRQGNSSNFSVSLSTIFNEMMAVIQTAMNLFKGYSLRNVGVMAINLLLTNDNKGCMGKIATGEGKSGLVAALATIKCLYGDYVDIITSSPVLARRDAEEWAPFFAMFGLSALENSGVQEEIGVPKTCYRCNIVYGDASTFEGDVLREEFSLLGTRGGRPFQTAIVDEVDSMFIDGSNHSTRLIDKMPQMDTLEPLFALIWNYVVNAAQSVTHIEGHIYAMGRCYGSSNTLPSTIFNSLPTDFKTRLKFDDPSTFLKILQNFCESMKQEELVDEGYRAQVVNVLRNKSLQSQLPSDVLRELEQEDKLSQNSPVISTYIKSKWEMSLTNPPYILKAVETLLNIRILIYENISEELVLCKVFHQDLSYEGSQGSDEVFTLRYFFTENKLNILCPVEDERSYIASLVEKTIREKVRSSLTIPRPVRANGHLQAHGDPSEEKKFFFYIPWHLMELYNCKIDEWIQSAIQGNMYLELNSDYVMKPSDDDEDTMTITPVDYRNTGVTQESCVWGEGLHQFLQLKHKLKVTPEYLATNFISNLSFFNRYAEGRNVFGVTGTLGDKNEVELLKHMYQVNTINVPTFKTKRLLELKPIVAANQTEWLTAISNCVEWETCVATPTDGRAVLIICQTIQDVDTVHTFLRGRLPQSSHQKYDLRLYFRSDDVSSESVVSSALCPGSIVIATNLAGRGTNIKLSKEVVANGGLHVIISFLPSNLRVEEQAAGRAARAGDPGTCQLIINGNTSMNELGNGISALSSLSIESIKKERNETEKRRVDNIKNKLMRELYIEEKQFKKYCQLKAYIQQVRKTEPNTVDHVIDGVGERWAIELEETKTRCDVLDWDLIDKKFDDFFERLRDEFLQQQAIRNPSYYTLQGKDFSLNENFEEAINHFNLAINLDHIHSQHAYYNRAYALINEAGEDYKEKAANDMQDAANIINDYTIPHLSAMHSLVELEKLKTTKEKYEEGEVPALQSSPSDSAFTKQLINKINFNYLVVKSINEALKVIQESKGELVAEYGDISEFYKKSDQIVNYNDIADMEDNGFVRFFYVKTKPVPWYSIFAVFMLGVLQIAAGVCLTLLGAGNVGPGLIAEGVADFVVGITTCVTGEFSWKDYLKNKALSIGVSLLLAGAGVAISSLSALPKVANAITTIKGLTIVKRLTTAGTTIGRFIKNTLTSVQTGLSNLWQATKNFVQGAWNMVKNSSQFKWLGKQFSTAWSHAPKALHKVKDKLVEWGKKVGEFARKSYDYFFGTQSLSSTTSKNLRFAGQLIAREGLKQGLIAALDNSALKAIGDGIESSIYDSTNNFFVDVLHGNTPTRDKLQKVFLSSNGRQFETKVSTEVGKALEDNGSFGKTVYQKFIEDAGGAVVKAIQQKLVEHGVMDAKQTGVFAIAKHVLDQILATITRSVALGEAIAELSSTLPNLMTTLNSTLDEMLEEIELLGQGSEQNSNPIDSRDLPRIYSDYADTWARKIASRMRDLIMGNVISPVANMSLTAALDRFTNAEDFQDILDKKAESNRARLASKFLSSPAPPIKAPSADSEFESAKLPDKDGQDKVIPTGIESDNKGEKTDALLTLLSNRFDAAIELYIDLNQNEICMQNRYGSEGGTDDGLSGRTIRILEQKNSAGEVNYVTMTRDGLVGAPGIVKGSNNLVESLIVGMAGSGGGSFPGKDAPMGAKQLRKVHTEVADMLVANRPMLLGSFSENLMKGRVSRNVLLGTYDIGRSTFSLGRKY